MQKLRKFEPHIETHYPYAKNAISILDIDVILLPEQAMVRYFILSLAVIQVGAEQSEEGVQHRSYRKQSCRSSVAVFVAHRVKRKDYPL